MGKIITKETIDKQRVLTPEEEQHWFDMRCEFMGVNVRGYVAGSTKRLHDLIIDTRYDSYEKLKDNYGLLVLLANVQVDIDAIIERIGFGQVDLIKARAVVYDDICGPLEPPSDQYIECSQCDKKEICKYSGQKTAGDVDAGPETTSYHEPFDTSGDQNNDQRKSVGESALKGVYEQMLSLGGETLLLVCQIDENVRGKYNHSEKDPADFLLSSYIDLIDRPLVDRLAKLVKEIPSCLRNMVYLSNIYHDDVTYEMWLFWAAQLVSIIGMIRNSEIDTFLKILVDTDDTVLTVYNFEQPTDMRRTAFTAASYLTMWADSVNAYITQYLLSHKFKQQ